jgi:hypothetical protein
MAEAVPREGFAAGVALGLGVIPAAWWCERMIGSGGGWIMFPVFLGLALTVGSGGFDGFSVRRAAGVVAGMLVFVGGATLLLLPLLMGMS